MPKKAKTRTLIKRQSTKSPATRLRRTLSMNYRQANLDYLEDYGDQPIPVFSDDQIEELFNARCADL